TEPGQARDTLATGVLAPGQHLCIRELAVEVTRLVRRDARQRVARGRPAGIGAGQGLVILAREIRRRRATLERGLVGRDRRGRVAGSREAPCLLDVAGRYPAT